MDSKLMKTPIFLLPLLFATAVYAGEPVTHMVPGPYSAQTAEERAQVSQEALDQAKAPAPETRQQYQDHMTKSGVEAHKAEAAVPSPADASQTQTITAGAPYHENELAKEPAPPQHPPCATPEACLIQVMVEKWFAAEVAAAKMEALQRAAPK